jgi:nitroreductase
MSYIDRPVSENHILELLNVAIWAPNDGMREPWRFIFIGSSNTDLLSELQDQAPAYLILVIKEDHDPHKREEDYAAASCLMQNFRLLAQDRMLQVRTTMNNWIYDRACTRRLGVHDDERIVAVLELGYHDRSMEPVKAENTPDLTFELL